MFDFFFAIRYDKMLGCGLYIGSRILFNTYFSLLMSLTSPHITASAQLSSSTSSTFLRASSYIGRPFLYFSLRTSAPSRMLRLHIHYITFLFPEAHHTPWQSDSLSPTLLYTADHPSLHCQTTASIWVSRYWFYTEITGPNHIHCCIFPQSPCYFYSYIAPTLLNSPANMAVARAVQGGHLPTSATWSLEKK